MSDPASDAGPGPIFSPLKAAFAVFDEAARTPRPFWRVMTVYLLIAALLFAPAGAFMLTDLMRGDWPWSAGPYAAWRAFANLASLAMWAVGAAAEAALLRWLLRPDDPRAGRMRLGVEELKLMLIFFLNLVIVAAAIIVSLLGVVLLAVMFGAVGLEALAAMSIFLGLIAGGIVSVWLLVRFSPAAALTVRRGGFPYFTAWRATRGVFWRLLGAHILRVAVMLAAGAAAAVLVAIIGLILIAPVLGQALSAVMSAELSAVPAYGWGAAGAAFLIAFLIFTALQYVQRAMSAGIGARLVQAREGAVSPAGDSG